MYECTDRFIVYLTTQPDPEIHDIIFNEERYIILFSFFDSKENEYDVISQRDPVLLEYNISESYLYPLNYYLNYTFFDEQLKHILFSSSHHNIPYIYSKINKMMEEKNITTPLFLKCIHMETSTTSLTEVLNASNMKEIYEILTQVLSERKQVLK